jgi:PII-like signaling protein
METNYETIKLNYKKKLLHKKYTPEVLDYSENEQKANEKFIDIVKRTTLNPNFNLSVFDYWDEVKSTFLFKVISAMPKGGLLHHHLLVHANYEYLTKIASNEEKVYLNTKEEKILFFNGRSLPENYEPLQLLNLQQKVLKNYFLFHKKDKDQYLCWKQFEKKVFNGQNILSNTKYFKNYLITLFNDCLDEGILIYQPRHLFGTIREYETNKIIPIEEEISIITEAVDHVKKRNNLFEVNLIYSEIGQKIES